jgi:hypothetical protein
MNIIDLPSETMALWARQSKKELNTFNPTESET